MSLSIAQRTARNIKFAAGNLESYGAGTLPDGTAVQFPGDMPEVGDLLQVVPAEGEPGPAPAGEHTITVGDALVMVMVDENGVITEVITQEDSSQNAENSDKPKDAGMSVEKELAAMRAELEEAKKAMLSVRGLPVNNNPPTTGKKMDNALASKEEIQEGMRILRMAESRDPELKKQAGSLRKMPSGKRYAANPDNKAISRSLTWFRELFYQDIPENSVFNLMTRRSVPEFEGSSTSKITVDIPRSRNQDGGLQLDNGCGYTPAGNTVLDTRKMDVVATKKDWDPICAQNVRHFFEGVWYQGQRRIPAEAAFLAQHTQQYMRDVQKAILFGDAGIGLTGIIPGLRDDSEYDAPSQSASITTPSKTTAVAGIDTLVDLLVAKLGQLGLPIDGQYICGLPISFYNFYQLDYRDQFGANNWNNGFLKSGPDSILDITFVPLYDMGNFAFITKQTNFIYAMEQREPLDVRDDPRTREILVTDKFAIGGSYVFANEYVQVTW